jgi:GNAT superfamily N-acetyltransferase
MARPGDEGIVHGFVLALAEFEKLAHEVEATEADVSHALFGDPARAEALIVEVEGKPVGFALWFFNFSTFHGRHGLYLEDIFVDPAHRGQGIARSILRFLARRAVDQGCTRVDWDVLDWNEDAIRFYRSIGAVPKTGWTRQRLQGDALEALARAT